MKTIMHVCFCLVVADMSISAQSAAPNSDLSRLFAAKKTGDLSQVRASISSGVAINARIINARTPDSMTPLMLAADSGQKKIVQELIANGADVNIRIAFYGISALSLALRQRASDKEIVELLLKAGVRHDIHDDRNNIPRRLIKVP